MASQEGIRFNSNQQGHSWRIPNLGLAGILPTTQAKVQAATDDLRRSQKFVRWGQLGAYRVI